MAWRHPLSLLFALGLAHCSSGSGAPGSVGSNDGGSDGSAVLSGMDGSVVGIPDGAPLSDGGTPVGPHPDGGDGGHGEAGAPLSTPVQPLIPGAAFYPRAILTKTGSIVASVVSPQASGHLGGTILRSDDDGVHFAVVGHIDDPVMASGLCCATLFELPAALGSLPAGTLLWAASVGGDTQGRPMSIPAWKSADGGATWSPLSTVVTAAVPRSSGGLWEPEFSTLADGTLVCHYSDETEAGHSQVLAEVRTSDGITWGSRSDTVALTPSGDRPGMANVRVGPGGQYFMSYEVCGTPTDGCAAHLRISADGWNWGSPTDPGLMPLTVDGSEFRHAPTLAYDPNVGANGRLYMVGQLVFDSAGNVAPENGAVLFANTEGGFQRWYEVSAPVPVPTAYDNFCPNYSSPLLPLDHGAAVLEIASAYDGTDCRSYFARGALQGTGDDTGITSGATLRLLSVQSALCLDVAGGATTAGSRIQQWTCNGLSTQNWTLGKVASGVYTLTAQSSGLCLAVAGNATAPGALVEQDPCDGRDGESWNLRNVGFGYYALARGSTGSCLDVAGGSTTAGGNVQEWTCNQLSPQIWHLEP